MILTEEKTYIINVTEVDTDAELGLNKKDIMIKYTNLELLHAVLASTMPYGRLSARYRGKRKAELQSRIAMVESVLETRGDQLAKAEQIMYGTAEPDRAAGGEKICKIQRCIPPGSDRIRKAERMERLGAGRQEREQPGGLWKRMPGGVGDREDQ